MRLETRLQALWSGYGELWRVELVTERESGRAIVKDVRPPSDGTGRSHSRKLRSYAVEHAFYSTYASRCGDACRVPRALALRAEPGGFLSVLEDLDSAGFAGRRRAPSAVDITVTLEWLAQFHALFMGQEPEQLWNVGTYWQLATRPDELAAMRPGALREAASAIDARLNAARFKSFVHGDAKLENVCFASHPATGAVALVDFQYVGGGVGVKDVAYFLSSCLAPQECGVLVPHYVDRYFEQLRSALVRRRAPVSPEEVEAEWRALFPLAWVDLYRFLQGWAPGAYDPDPFSDAMTAEVLRGLRQA